MKETDIFLGFWISQIRLVNDRIFEKLLLSNDLEISRGQWNIIFVLWGEDHLTISEISERTLLAKNTVSIIVNDMVKKGIVQRNINPENRREAIVSLTEHVRSLRGKYERISKQMTEILCQDLSEDDQKILADYLQRILRTLVRYEQEHQ